jgi:mono/diheme cytochrome c family protein
MPSPTEHPLTVKGYAIVSGSSAPGAAVHAVAGDALQLRVVQLLSDGSSRDVPAPGKVTWTEPATIKTLPPESMAESPLPKPGADPVAGFIDNAARSDTTRPGALYVFDAGSKPKGTIAVKASVAGIPDAGDATLSIAVSTAPAGKADHGATVYAANCAHCHGDSGAGSPPVAGMPMKYMIAGQLYDFPAAGLNAAKDNAAGDANWNAALFAIAARGDFDNAGVTLRAPMPNWLTHEDTTTRATLSTQDLVDVFAWLKTKM